jgi:hypothetical protein
MTDRCNRRATLENRKKTMTCSLAMTGPRRTMATPLRLARQVIENIDKEMSPDGDNLSSTERGVR